MQLTKQQRFSCNSVAYLRMWCAIPLPQVVSQEFSENFPERNVPNKTTIWQNVKKYREESTKRM